MAEQTKTSPTGEVLEAHDQQTTTKTGENNASKAEEGAVEGGWNGSVAGTNDAMEDSSQK